jgi:DNA mismatch repair protein MutS
MLERLLVPEPPFLARDGGFIAAGAHAPLDEVRALRDESRRVIASLEARYRESSGVAALRIKHNGVLGYFIELTPPNADKLLASAARDLFRHRQTIGSAVRFSTDELANLASRIAEAAEQALALERELFDAMTAEAMAASTAFVRHRRRAGAARCGVGAGRTRRRRAAGAAESRFKPRILD